MHQLPSSSLTSKQQWVAQQHSSCPSVEPGKGCRTRVSASSRHTLGCHKPQAGFLCSYRTRRNQVSVILHTQTPPPSVTGQAVTGPGPGPYVPPRCPSTGTSVFPLGPAGTVTHGCLGHWLGSHVQWARSVRCMGGSPTALAYQLPRVSSSTPGPEPPQRALSRQGHSCPYGQHSDLCVYQKAMWFAFPSHVATHPSPPPLESEASEVASCHPHPRSVQSGGQRAVLSGTSWGVETPSPGSPADLESVRSCSGRPVCFSRNHPLPVVLLPIQGNARHGCTGTQLAPGPVQICIPQWAY